MTKIDPCFITSVLYALADRYPVFNIEVWDATLPEERQYLQRLHATVGSHHCYATIMNDYDTDYREVTETIARQIDREMKGDSNG